MIYPDLYAIIAISVIYELEVFMSGFLSSILAKALVMLLEALVMRVVQSLVLTRLRQGGLLPV
ncbi:hypothetical protein GCM10017673_17640 [Streptosporangium violaceochromogenes]|nr:hypothetical protein GCM10017673_17640 [Streptosporangium violaceochromogenes]